MATHAPYSLLQVARAGGVTTVTIVAPPCNHLTMALGAELTRLSRELARDAHTRVVVVRSDIPGFFLPHADLAELMTIKPPPEVIRRVVFAGLRACAYLGFPGRWVVDRALGKVSPVYAAFDRLRRLPAITIAVVEGRIGGVGSELALALDMRFGARGLAVLNQLEVACGAFPGAGGTQRFPQLLGLGRAFEVIMGSDDVDADTAERWGYFNRVLPPDELRPFVDALAQRIATYPATALEAAKRHMLRAVPLDRKALQLEAIGFFAAIFSEPAKSRIQRFVARGGQTDGASRLGRFNGEL